MADTKQPNVPAIAATFYNNEGECGVGEMPKGMILAFSDGAKITVREGDITSDNIAHALAWHGLKQKLVDAAAISRNPETGRAASVADKRAAVQEVLDRLLAGEWNKAREGGGAGGLLFRALVRMYDGKRTPDDIKAFLESKTDAEKAALRKNSTVAAMIETIRAETGDAASIDTDAMLAGLGE